jgi:hypothetical protein
MAQKGPFLLTAQPSSGSFPCGAPLLTLPAETKRNETKRNETKAIVFQRHLALVLSLAWQIIAFHKEEKQRLSPHAPLRTRRRQTLIVRNLHTCSGEHYHYVQASGLVAPFSLRCAIKTAGFERKRPEI